MQQFLRSKMMAGLVFYMLLQTGLKRQFETLSRAATHVSAETPTLWTSMSRLVTNRFLKPHRTRNFPDC
ncbi:hypothetical protein SAMN04487998_1623 [Hymenobacter actinosclerus]|uniref:Uncharacterized protein n=2 Tax=Hymenobacter actinosclerus TaxID=82805 RepID=A0A1I0E0H1_9BACT|nr:hypothetical protein SAMN04487998_1623 [Hymenobacter actinosclerus]